MAVQKEKKDTKLIFERYPSGQFIPNTARRVQIEQIGFQVVVQKSDGVSLIDSRK